MQFLDNNELKAPSISDEFVFHTLNVAAFLLTFVMIIFPKAVIGFLIFFMLVLFCMNISKLKSIIRDYNFSLIDFSIFSFFFYLIVNSLFALNPILASTTSIRISLILIILLASIELLKHTESKYLREIIKYLVIGAFAGIVWLALEMYFSAPITTFIYSNFTDNHPLVGKRGIFVGDDLIGLNPVTFNKHAGALILVLFPTLLIANSRFKKTYSKFLFFGVLMVGSFTIIVSHNETTKIALTAGLMTLLISMYSKKLIHWLLLSGFFIAIIAAIPSAKLPMMLDLHKASWVANSAKERFYIWDYTADQTALSPMIGFGTVAARHMSRNYLKKNLISEKTRNGNQLHYWSKENNRFYLHSHAHNGFLQIWFDLGAIGSLSFLFICFAVFQRINKLPDQLKPTIYAFCASVFFVVLTGFGFWQTWLWTVFSCSVLAIVAAAIYLDKIHGESSLDSEYAYF